MGGKKVRDIVDTVPWTSETTGRAGLNAEGMLKVVLGAMNRRLDRKNDETNMATPRCTGSTIRNWQISQSDSKKSSTHPGDPWFNSIKALAVKGGALQQYQSALEQLASKLRPTNGFKALTHALVWKFDRKEIDLILSRIERLKSLASLALNNDLL